MKKYIILTGSIIDIGGSQLYSKNKKIFLEDNGWNVSIYSFQCGRIRINELIEYNEDIIYNLKFSPNLLSEVKRNKIINQMIGKEAYEEVVIESHSVNLALWGEILAKETGGKHITVLVDETFEKLSNSKFAFLNFKHERRELAGINEKSLELLFGEQKKILPNERYCLRLVSNNVVVDVDNEIINKISRKDINIGCITRLEKSYVMPLVNQVIKFAKLNESINIQLIFFGGSYYEEFKKIISKKVRGVNNLSLTITGYLYPMPRKLFKIVDIFVGASGSARTSLNENVLTVSIDVISGNPIGLLGIDTNSTLYCDANNTKSLSFLLQEVLIEKQMHKKDIVYKKKEITFVDFRKEFIKHTQFIEESNQSKKYFPVSEVKPNVKEIVKTIVLKISGNKIGKKMSYLKIRRNSMKLVNKK